MIQSASSTRSCTVPYLTLADIFICALSVLFILLLLSNQNRVIVNRLPQADLVLTCSQGLPSLVEDPDNQISELPRGGDLRARLQVLDNPQSLSARLLLRAATNDLTCIEHLRNLVNEINTSLSERLDAGQGGSYLLLDVEYLGEGAEHAGAQP